MVLGVFHALQGDFKGDRWGEGVHFFTKATYLYGNYYPTVENIFGQMVPLRIFFFIIHSNNFTTLT